MNKHNGLKQIAIVGEGASKGLKTTILKKLVTTNEPIVVPCVVDIKTEDIELLIRPYEFEGVINGKPVTRYRDKRLRKKGR